MISTLDTNKIVISIFLAFYLAAGALSITSNSSLDFNAEKMSSANNNGGRSQYSARHRHGDPGQIRYVPPITTLTKDANFSTTKFINKSSSRHLPLSFPEPTFDLPLPTIIVEGMPEAPQPSPPGKPLAPGNIRVLVK